MRALARQSAGERVRGTAGDWSRSDRVREETPKGAPELGGLPLPSLPPSSRASSHRAGHSHPIRDLPGEPHGHGDGRKAVPSQEAPDPIATSWICGTGRPLALPSIPGPWGAPPTG